jgi:hypothetical protein
MRQSMLLNDFHAGAVLRDDNQRYGSEKSSGPVGSRWRRLQGRWQLGNRSAATCISCDGCFEPGLEEGGIYTAWCRRRKTQKGVCNTMMDILPITA